MDIQLVERGNGGEFLKKGNGDLQWAEGYENQPYLALFGGNDWWGNFLLDEGKHQTFISRTETVLRSVALNSAGRQRVEAAILEDLDYLKKIAPGTKISVLVTIPSPDRMDMLIDIDGQQFYLQWNPAEGALKYSV